MIHAIWSPNALSSCSLQPIYLARLRPISVIFVKFISTSTKQAPPICIYLYSLIAGACCHPATIIIKYYVVYNIFVIRNDWLHIEHVYFLLFICAKPKKTRLSAEMLPNVVVDN